MFFADCDVLVKLQKKKKHVAENVSCFVKKSEPFFHNKEKNMDFALSCVMSSGKSLWPPVQCKSSKPANMYIYVNTECAASWL